MEFTPIRKTVIVALFLATIFLPLFVTISGVNLYPSFIENRRLASFPAEDLRNLRIVSFAKGLESFINDNFGFRPYLISLINSMKYSMFGVSGNRNVLVGKDGFIFLGWRHLDISDYRFTNRLDEELLRNWTEAMEERRQWLAGGNAKFYFLPVSNKGTIYPHKLPGWIERVGKNSRLDQLIDYMRLNSAVDVIDVRPALQKATKKRQTYYKKDTHWNHYGAFAAAQTVIERLSHSFPQLEPASISDHRKSYESKAPMNSGVLLGVPFTGKNWELEPINGWTSKKEIRPLLKGEMKVYTRDDPKAPSLVMYGDSFTSYMERFLAEHFRRAVFCNIWEFFPTANEQFPLEIIDREKPDIVIYQRVERALGEKTGNPDGIERDFTKLTVPDLSNWTLLKGVKLAREKEDYILSGDNSENGYQAVSPGISVWPDTRVSFRLPMTVTGGSMAVGVLDETGSKWIDLPRLADKEYTFNTGDNRSISIAIVNNDNKQVESGALVHTSAESVPLAIPEFDKWQLSEGVKLTVTDDSYIVDGDDSAFRYQANTQAIEVDSYSRYALSLPVRSLKGKIALGILDENRTRWILPPTRLKKSYIIDTGANRAVTIIIANDNKNRDGIERTRFDIPRQAMR